jgi:eukaryotic-like serine/threonine-protein kinase
LTHLIGKQLGRYTIQEEIGRGGMARVYRAQDTQLKRIVAIKVLLPQLAVDPEFAQRFEREAVTAANLRHPNIVTIYDVGEQDSLRYIAMEYVRGHTLHAIIKERGALGLGYAITIVGPVAAALDYAHRQGAVHRDIKPQNIMIDVDGRVLLTDFGIAQAPEGGSGGGERLTRTGIFMGTPEYISPEQASAQRVDGRSDLYSLGIATYEVITGNVPFSGATPQLIVAHAQTPPPPISTQDQDLPPELDLVMARILAKRPDQRFATGAAFTDELRSVARKYGLAVASPRQLAVLVPSTASAAESAIARSREPVPPAASPPPVAPRLGSSDPTQVGPTSPRPAAPTMPPRSRPAVLPPASPRDVARDEYDGESERAPVAVPRRRAAPEPPDNGGGRRGAMVIGGLFGGLLLVVLFVIINRPFTGAGPNVTPTRPLPPASTLPTITPSATPTVTQTPVPTIAPTEQLIESTAVPDQPPPTAEPVAPPPLPVEPSSTPEPPPPDTPTPPPPSVEPSATPSPSEEPATVTSTSPPTLTTEETVSPSPETTAAATVSPAATAPATETATAPLATTIATAAPTALATIELSTPTGAPATPIAQPSPELPTATPTVTPTP